MNLPLRRFALAAAAAGLVLSGAAAAQWPAPPGSAAPVPSATRQRLERELALIRHIRQHLVAPGDGLSLAADRRDLGTLVGANLGPVPDPGARPPVPGARPPVAGARTPAPPVDSDSTLADLEVLAEIWSLRVNDRIAFVLMPPDRLQRLDRAQGLLSRLAAAAPAAERDAFYPAMQDEMLRLRGFASGRGEMPESIIELSLSVADSTVTGRVGPGAGVPPLPPGAYPPGPGGATPPGTYPPGATAPVGGAAGQPPPPRPPAPGTSSSGLPPGYAAFVDRQPPGGCQVERRRASDSGDPADMVRVADCWSRNRSWPGWGDQLLEALDWAAEFAWIARDCAQLDAVITRIRGTGPVAGFQPDSSARLPALARQAQEHLMWMRAHSTCTTGK